MVTLSIEIGSCCVRAAVLYNNGKEIVPVGTSQNPYHFPSVASCDNEGAIVVGDEAVQWQYHDISRFKRISDIDHTSEWYIPVFSAVYSKIKKIAERFCGETIADVIIIVSSYFSNMDPRKDKLKQAAEKAGFSNVSFDYDAQAICMKRAYMSDGEHAVVFDLGYSGLKLSVIRQFPGGFEIVQSKFISDIGGMIADSIIANDIQEKCGLYYGDSNRLMLLANNYLEQTITTIKEKLTTDEEVVMPIALSEKMYSVSAASFRAKLSQKMSPALNALSGMIKEYKDKNLHKILLCGGSSRIPFVEEYIAKYLSGQFNERFDIQNFSKQFASEYDACLGTYINNQTITINF